jgi:hypothetical protein
MTDNQVGFRQLPPAVRGFLRELPKDPELAPFSVTFERAVAQLDLTADSDADALGLMTPIEWVASQSRSAGEKLDVIIRLSELKGKVRVDLKAFTGW